MTGQPTSHDSSAEVLNSCAPSRSQQVICSFVDCPIVPPEILREWLRENCDMLRNAIGDLNNRKDAIADAPTPERLQASSIVLNSLDFLEVADVAKCFLGDEHDPTLSQAFLAGLRLGLLRERIQALADGRFKRGWNATARGEEFADTVNEAHKELWDKYQPEVEKLMATGMSYTPATDEVGKRMGVSGRTVREHTDNPRPQNRGRKR